MTEAPASLRKCNVKKTLCFGILIIFTVICDTSIARTGQFSQLFKYMGYFLPVGVASLRAVLTLECKDYEEIVKAWVMEKDGFGKRLKHIHYMYLGAFLLCIVSVIIVFILTSYKYILLNNLLLILSVIILHHSETAVLDKIEKSL